MLKVDYLLCDRRGLLSAFASTLDDLPETYGLAMIDKEKSSQSDHGRVLGYDRGHCQHHAESGTQECHCHHEGMPVSHPHDCRFVSVLDAFCQAGLDYWLAAGFDWTSSLSDLLDPTEIIAKMMENDDE